MNSGRPARTGRTGPVIWCHSHFLLPTGGTKYVYEVVRRIKRDRPIEVVVERASEYWRERYTQAGVPLHEISGLTSTSKRYWLEFPRQLRHAGSEVARLADELDAGHLASSFFPFNRVCGEVASKRGLRHTHLCFEPFPFFHDREVQGMYPPAQRTLMRALGALYGRIDRAGVRSADELLTLNEITRDAIERTYGRTDAVPVYTGIDHDHFRPFSDAELTDLRERHGSGVFAVHSTDFSPIKRTDLALEAFAVAARSVDAKLLITSTIDDPSSLGALIKRAGELGVADRIEYLGFVDYDDLPR
ncbi:MAG: glycosyltransferase [Solirubrobacterales bacterium]